MSSKDKAVEAVNAYKAIYAVADAEDRQLTSTEAKAVEKHLAIAQRYQGTAAAEEFLRQPAHICYCHGRPYGRRRLVYTIIRTFVRMKGKEREHPRDSLSQSTSEPQGTRGATRPQRPPLVSRALRVRWLSSHPTRGDSGASEQHRKSPRLVVRKCGGSGGSRLATGRLFLHKFSPPGLSQS
jgi:hypothetical protein